jgi:hypothetical protein
MSWIFWILATLSAAACYAWFQLRQRKQDVSLALATQAAGMRIVSWAIEKAYEQADGVISIEAVISDRHGHDASIQVTKPSLAAAADPTCEEFIRLNYTPGKLRAARAILPSEAHAYPGTKFKIEEARIEVRQGGQLHVIRFSNRHLSTLLSVLMDAVSQMTTQEDASIDGLPVKAELRWVPPKGREISAVDRSLYSVHHDVTPAISRLAGPRARWWRAEGDEKPLLVVTNHAIISECLRYLYDLRSTHRLLRHLSRCEVTIDFLSGERVTIDSEDDPLLAFSPWPPLLK